MSRRFAMCVGQFPNGNKCGALVDTFEHPELGMELFSRGNRKAYLCPECARRVYSYDTENNTWLGTFAKEPWSTSQELETMSPTYKARVEFEANGYIPTSDCTVSVEYKSPIWRNFKSLVHYAKTIERLMESGDIVIDSNCGTHTHVGHPEIINRETMYRFFRSTEYYTAFFKPLSDAMRMDEDKVARVFGRPFDYWARYPVFGDPEEHTNWVNVQHDNTLEFRILRFVTAEQYSMGVMFVKSLCETLKARFFDTISAPGWSGDELEQACKAGEALRKEWEKLEV